MIKKKPFIGFITPGFILYTLFMILPIIVAIYYSFFNWNGIGEMDFIGLDNYKKLFFDTRTSKIFSNTLLNNAKYLLSVLLIITPIQIFFAYILYIKISFYKYLQLMLFLPYVISTSIVGFFSIIIFDPNIGVLNQILGILGMEKQAWLGDPNLSFKLLVLVVIWQSIGSGMMIFYANMQEIPRETLEAAYVDGAGEIQKFFYVVLPQLTSSLITNFVLGTIYALTIFDIPFMLGGPTGGVNNSLDFVNTYFYRSAFGGSYFGVTSLGFGSSISVTMFVLIFIISVLQMVLTRRFKSVN